MSWDEEEDDSPEAEPLTPPAALPLPDEIPVMFTVSSARMQDEILRQVSAQVTKAFERTMSDKIEESVQALVEQISREHIAEAVRATLAEGWTVTDEYGGAKGKATLKDRISKILNDRDRYSSHGAMWERIVKEESDKALRGELKEEIEQARLKLRAEVDGVIRVKLNDALRESLGLSKA